MRYIKTYESFNINETMDMMTMPVDPIAGAADVYKDIAKAIGNKIDEITKSLKKAALPEVEKIKDYMFKIYGTTVPAYTEENAEKLYKALGLDSVKESLQEGENLAIQLCGRVKQVLGVNIYAWAGIPLAIVLGGMMAGSTAAVFGILIGSWALLWVFTKIMQVFGYGNDDTDVAEIGNYNPSQDIRR
jgi:hypothetical protein